MKPNRNKFENLWCHDAIRNLRLEDRVQILILPVHAPDLNPIEMWWGNLKGGVSRRFAGRRTMSEVETELNEVRESLINDGLAGKLVRRNLNPNFLQTQMTSAARSLARMKGLYDENGNRLEVGEEAKIARYVAEELLQKLKLGKLTMEELEELMAAEEKENEGLDVEDLAPEDVDEVDIEE